MRRGFFDWGVPGHVASISLNMKFGTFFMLTRRKPCAILVSCRNCPAHNVKRASKRSLDMQTQFSSDVPDGTYFRTGDAEPSINEDGSIIILDGNGSSRSWGRPGVTSTVVYDDCDLIAVHIGFH